MTSRTGFALALSVVTLHAFGCASETVIDPGGTGTTTTGGEGGGGGAGGGTGGVACQPVDETCDGVDNDCDGEVDEPPCACKQGDTTPCYGGPDGTEGVGICAAGARTCDARGVLGPCVGEVLPAAAETCDGDDDDCDGQIDDMDDVTCGVGACQVTVQACAAGQLQTCTPGMPAAEGCDGIDNDCDQLVDEADPMLGVACDSGLLGVCAPGKQECLQGALTCVPDQMAGGESCNGLDDDCNGQVDDSIPGTGGMCSTGFPGPCSAGTISCQNGAIDCFPDVAPAPEDCDAVDNDCDGTVDEQAPCPSPLTCSNGACALVCMNGTVECNGACVNTSTDAQNCGACNNPCGPGLICNAGTCQSPLFTFSGVLNNVPIASLVGWSQCYVDSYANSSTPLASILAACSQPKLLLGCRTTGSSTLLVAANAPRVDVIFDTGTGNVPHNANGVGWYFSNGWSWGFALQGDPINRNSCDTVASSLGPGVNGNLRLCWHTGGGNINGGWRCGTSDSLFGASHERLVFQAP